MNILLIRGERGTGCDFFLTGLRSAFLDLGHDIEIFDIGEQPYQQEELQRKVAQFQPDFSLGFNQTCPFLGSTEVRDMFDALDLPHFAYFIDHPLHHFDRFENPLSDNLYISVVDPTHKDYLAFRSKQDRVYFLPHAVAEDYFAKKTSATEKILFCGSVSSPEKFRQQLSSQLPPREFQIFQRIVQEKIQDFSTSHLTAVRRVLSEFGGEELIADEEYVTGLMTLLDKYIRRKFRVKVLTALKGLPVVIQGNVEVELAERFKSFGFEINREWVGREQIYELISHHRAVLNISHFFPAGLHVRVVNGLARQTPVISTESKIIKKWFGPTRGVWTFNPGDPASIRKSTVEFLEEIPKTKADVERGMQAVGEKHTWKQRANRIIEIITAEK